MRKTVLATALAALALPALALAAQPVLIRVGGRSAPMREVVRVIHTAAGPVRVRTWSWRGPHGAALLQVSESRGAAPGMPSRALQRLRALQAQMRQMQWIEAALTQPFARPSAAVQVAFGQPVLLPLLQRTPLEVRFLQPLIRRAAALPERVIVILAPPAAAHRVPPVRTRHRGHLT